MSKIGFIAAAFVLAFTTLVASRPAQAGNVEVHENYLKFGGINYFRTGFDRVTLGAYGEKKTPIDKPNYLEVQTALDPAKLDGKITTASIVAIDFSASSKTSIEANLGGMKVVNTGASVTYSALKEGKLVLVHLVVTPVDMKTALNASSTALRNLKSYGGDARVAHEIFVVMEAALASSFTSSVDFDVSGTTTGGVTITGKVGNESSGTTVIRLPAGTTFAYLLGKLKWNDGKTKIEKITDDQANSMN